MDSNVRVFSGKEIKKAGYIHSSNSLFHFMSKRKYLEEILKQKALVPRYCSENIEYLNLSGEAADFCEVVILQKCFCDIPLHRIKAKIRCKILCEDEGENAENRELSHVDLYGEYAIGLKKAFGERNNIQPVNYVNPEANYIKELSHAISEAIAIGTDLNVVIANNFLNIISFLKPLSGEMKRTKEKGAIEKIYKNFFDENEWRYVPKYNERMYQPVIANPYIIDSEALQLMSKELIQNTNEKYWLPIEYSDISTIIVPDNHARKSFIEFIMSLNEEDEKKLILISKIIVLDEMEGGC